MQHTHEVMREMHCFTYESARSRGSDAPFSGYLLFLFLLIVSRGTLRIKLAFSPWIEAHSARHSLKPIVVSPSPAASRIFLCSSDNSRLNTRTFWVHGLGISVG